jgi:tetratricopeptide (TPR) repeat protein
MDDNLITPSDFFNRGLDCLDHGDYQNAVNYFKEAISRDFTDPDVYVRMGEALFELGQAEDALEWFNKVSDAEGPLAEDLLLWKGSCYLELGKHRRAISSFNRAIELNPGLAEAHFKRGLVLFEMGQQDRALQAFDTALGMIENDAEQVSEVLLWKGRTLTRLGRRAEGLQLLHEAHERAPDMPGPYNEIADAYRFGGDYGSAEEWYKKGLERLPEDPSLHNDYGNLLRDLGRLEDSRKHLTTAIERDLSRSIAYYNRALTLERMGRGDDALKDYDTVIAHNPDDVDAKLRKVDLLAQLSMFVDARELLGSLKEEDRKTPEAIEAAARVFNREALRAEATGDVERALMCHEASVALHPDFLDVESPASPEEGAQERMLRLVELLKDVKGEHEALARLIEGAARYKLKQPEQSRRCLERALELNFQRPLVLTLLAELFFYELGKDKKALEFAAEAITLRPDFVRALWIKAVVLTEQGDIAAAVECYRRMLEVTPENPTVLLNLGDLYFDHGQPHRALDCYRRVLEERPGDVSVNRDIGLCYLAQQRYGEAIACFSRLEAEGVLQLEIKLDLAEAHLSVGDRAEAFTLIEQVRENNAAVDPNIDARAQELTACLENMRNNPKAALKALADLTPDRISTYGLVQQGRAHLALEDLKKAAKPLKEVIEELDPRAGDAVEARYYLARLEFDRNDFEKAHGHVEAILAVSPFEQRAYRLRAWMQMLAGELDEQDDTNLARKFAEEVSRCHRLLQHEDFKEAIASARELQTRYPGRLEPRYYLACALAQCGEDEAALEEVRAILKQDPSLQAQVFEEFYLESLRLKDRLEFRTA